MDARRQRRPPMDGGAAAKEQAQTRSGPLRSKSRRNKSDQRGRVHAKSMEQARRSSNSTGKNSREIKSALERDRLGSSPEREESLPKVLHGDVPRLEGKAKPESLKQRR